MDSHIQGPRGGNTVGAIVSGIGVGAKFGVAAFDREIFRTQASPEKPIAVWFDFFGVTGWDGDDDGFLDLYSTDLEGGNELVIDDMVHAQNPIFEVHIEPRIFKLRYSPSTGMTAGEIYAYIRVAGFGQAAI